MQAVLKWKVEVRIKLLCNYGAAANMLLTGSDGISCFTNTSLTLCTLISGHSNSLEMMSFQVECCLERGLLIPRSPYTVVTLCVSIQELTTKHWTLLWFGLLKCSLYTPQQLFSFSVWLYCSGWKYLMVIRGYTDAWHHQDPGTT